MIASEPFLGEQSCEDWIDQFESIAAITAHKGLKSKDMKVPLKGILYS